MRILASAALTVLALATGSALACEGKGGHDHAKTTADAEATLTSGTPAAEAGECAHKKGMDCTQCPKARAGECPHAKATTASAGKTGHADCPYARAAKTAHAVKPMADVTLAKATRVEAGQFSGSGKILCARCDLKKSETCRSMFKATGNDKLYGLCDGDLTDQIRKMTQHGELEVTVHGRVQASETGEDVVCIDGFSVGTI